MIKFNVPFLPNQFSQTWRRKTISARACEIMLIIVDIFDRMNYMSFPNDICSLDTAGKIFCHAHYWLIYEANSFDRGIRIDVNGPLSTRYVNYAYIGYNARNIVLTVDGNVHSWSASVCYISRCNVSEVSIDLSDVECIERSNALAVSNGPMCRQ